MDYFGWKNPNKDDEAPKAEFDTFGGVVCTHGFLSDLKRDTKKPYICQITKVKRLELAVDLTSFKLRSHC